MSRSFLHNLLLFCLTHLLLAVYTKAGAQELIPIINATFKDVSVAEALKEMTSSTSHQLYYKEDSVFHQKVSINFESKPLTDAINELLISTGYRALRYRDYAIVIMPRRVLEESHSPKFYQALNNLFPSEVTGNVVEIGNKLSANSSGRASLNLILFDTLKARPVSGAAVFSGGEIRGSSDLNGSLTIELPIGSHKLLIRSVGYEDVVQGLNLFEDGALQISLTEEAMTLNEVVISSSSQRFLESPQIGVLEISSARLEKLPAFLGEVDLIKGLEFLPGVSTIGEGAPGFNVRGGNVDHNLILYDEALIFNSSHVFGFFSAINSEAASSSSLYKGYVSPEFSGRLSSVLRIIPKEGNKDSLIVRGSLGLVSSKLYVEGPLKSGKTSFTLGGRASYSDYILGLFRDPDLRESSASFHDLNLGISHQISEESRLMFSYYRSYDDVTFGERFGFEYETNAIQGKAIFPLGGSLTAETSGVYGTYDATLLDPSLSSASASINGIDYLKLKQKLSLIFNESVRLSGGVSWINYQSMPGRVEPRSDISTTVAREVEDEQAHEYAGFLDVEWSINPKLALTSGLRYNSFSNRGPQQYQTYLDNTAPDLGTVVDTIQVASGKNLVTYDNFEPRISLRYRLNPGATLKAGYGRMVQNLFQISNTDAITPVDLWKLSDVFIKPQKSHNSSLGLFLRLNNSYDVSLEGFYRKIDQLVDYRDFANLIANENIETEISPGEGRAYGLELQLSKTLNKLKGDLSYTFSRSERRIINSSTEGSVNGGSWYPSTFDKPHNLALSGNLSLNSRQTLSLNFIYSTGRPTTGPEGFYNVDNILSVPFYSDRNQLRIPDYHRFDLSYSLKYGFRKNRKWRSSWTFTLYNVYSRKNAYSVFFTQSPLSDLKAQKLSVLGSAFPSITYNFRFLP